MSSGRRATLRVRGAGDGPSCPMPMTVPLSVALPGHAAPTASFEVPLEMLAACHGRVAAQCETLRRLVPHLAASGADRDATLAAAAVMRYFDTAARHHHADEENDLFPALCESLAAADPVCVRGLVDDLRADHRRLEARWAALRPTLAALAEGRAAALEESEAEAFIADYAAHIEREDRELLPLAARLLDDTALQRVGRTMRERRGVPAPG